MKKMKNLGIGWWGFLVIAICYSSAYTQNGNGNDTIKWQYDLIDKVEITDVDLIKFLLNQFFIPSENVTKLVIYDVTRNGFGEKDIAVTYPDGTIYFLDFINKEAQQKLQSWKPPDNYEMTGDSEDPKNYEIKDVAQSGVLVSLLWGVKRNLRNSPAQIWFRQDSAGLFKFFMTGYEDAKLSYTPSWPDSIRFHHPFKGDTSFVDYDLLRQYVENAFQEFNNDLLKIYITETDTVYIERDKATEKRVEQEEQKGSTF